MGAAAPAAVLPPGWALLLGALLLASPAAALDNGLRLPPLGWSSWCVPGRCFGGCDPQPARLCAPLPAA